MIERRRALEFAAMALAGEDEDDDEDEMASRRGSMSRVANVANGTGIPTKTLKGKETFKVRMTSRAELAQAVGDRKGKGKGFMEGVLDISSGGQSSSGSEEHAEEKRMAERDSGRARNRSGHRSRPHQASSSTSVRQDFFP